MTSDFLPDTPGRAALRRARWDVVCTAAMMMRNRGPAKLVDGEWVYGLTLSECSRLVLEQLRWNQIRTGRRDD